MAVKTKTGRYMGHWKSEAAEVWANIDAKLTIPDVRDNCSGTKVDFNMVFSPGGGSGFSIDEYRAINQFLISHVERTKSASGPWSTWAYVRTGEAGAWDATNDTLAFNWSKNIGCSVYAESEFEFYFDLPPTWSWGSIGITKATTLLRTRVKYKIETDSSVVTASSGDIIDFVQSTNIDDPLTRSIVNRQVPLP